MKLDIKKLSIEQIEAEVKKMKDLSFEELQKEMDEILLKIKQDDVTLSESGSLYVYGKEINRLMEEKVNQLSKYIKTISNTDRNNYYKNKNFNVINKRICSYLNTFFNIITKKQNQSNQNKYTF